MQFNIQAQLDRKANSGTQEQRIPARILWTVMIITTPALSPIYLPLLLIYQFCLVGRERLSTQAIAVTAVLAILFSISWIPVVNLALLPSALQGLKRLNASSVDVTNTQVNAITPLVVFVVFCVWGSFVAFKHFSLADSYEADEERASVRILAEIALDHPLAVRGEEKPITTALDLYRHLKGPMRHTVLATLVSLLLAGSTVSVVRLTSPLGTHDERSYVIYILTTVFFIGMFLVFYFTFAFVITLYLHQVTFIKRLTYAIEPPSSDCDVVSIQVWDIKQLRAWEECRRLGVDALTSSKSVLNSFFTPSMWLSALSSVGILGYLIARLLFQEEKPGQLAIAFIVILCLMLGFLMCCVIVAKIAQKHFKNHTALIAYKTFDVARRIDEHYTRIQDGLAMDDDQGAPGDASVPREVLQNLIKKNSVRRVEQGSGKDDASLLTLESVHATLQSLCTFMVANQPRPLLLGIELRHVRFVVVFAMIISANILFISLMVAFKQGKCQGGAGGPLATPSPTSSSFF
jgi:hypothetical protein